MPPHSAILLAGGQSSRMGTDKALLQVGSRTLLAHMQDLLAKSGIVDVVVSRNDGQPGHVADIVPNRGPLGGIHAGLSACLYRRVLIIPVDMPLLTPMALGSLLASPSGCVRFIDSELPCVVEKSPRLYGYLQRQLSMSGVQLSVRGMLEFLNATRLENTCAADQLTNTNTPEQWNHYAQEHQF